MMLDMFALALPQNVTDAFWQAVLLILGALAAGIALAARLIGKQITETIIAKLELIEVKAQAERDALIRAAERNAAGIETLRDGGTKDAVKVALSESGMIAPKEGA